MVSNKFNSNLEIWKISILEKISTSEFKSIISNEEFSVGNRFHFETDRYRYWLTRYTLRVLLGKNVGSHPRSLSFIKNKYGKPYLLNHTVNFSISHSNEYIVIAIGPSVEFGIDIQYKKDIKKTKSLFSACLIDKEISHICNATHQTALFYRYWTIKEALLKALGTGLHIPMTEIFVNFSNNTVTYSDKVLEHFLIYEPKVSKSYHCAIIYDKKIKRINEKYWHEI